MKNQIKRSILRRLRKSITWNLVGLMIFGLSGLGITFVIAYTYDAEALGFFNLLTAIFIISAQCASIGIHNSALMHLSASHWHTKEAGVILLSAVILVGIVNLPFTLGLYLFADVVANTFSIPSLKSGLKVLSLALFFFSINKVILFSLNGMQHIRIFALGQASRYGIMFLSVVLISVQSLPVKWLAVAFLIADFLLFLILCSFVISKYAQQLRISLPWIKKHLSYGFRGMGSGLFLTLNLNIDLLILGLFASQKDLGAYSLAAAIVVAIYHLLTAIRTSFNPILASLLASNDLAGIIQLVAVSRRYIFLIISIISVIIIISTYIIIDLFLHGKGFNNSGHFLLILVPGVIIYAMFFPFDQILAMGDLPSQQTFYNFTVLLSNTMLNIILVNLYGVWGSAIATSLVSIIMAPTILYFLVKNYLNIDIFHPH